MCGNPITHFCITDDISGVKGRSAEYHDDLSRDHIVVGVLYRIIPTKVIKL